MKDSGGIRLGAVWFNGNSTKLTNQAKATLDSLITQIQANSTMQVEAVTFNKDLCDQCGARSLDRSTAIFTYLSRHGISKDRLVYANRLGDKDVNKVELFLQTPLSNNRPHSPKKPSS